MGRFYEFSCRSAFPTPFGDVIFLFYVFTGILFSKRPPVAQSFCFAFLPAAFGGQRPPVAPSFVARRKIGEKGVPKGSKAALWILAFYTGVRRGDVRASYEFARVQLTRFRPARGVLRTVSTDSIVLHVMQRKCWNLKNNQPNL